MAPPSGGSGGGKRDEDNTVSGPETTNDQHGGGLLIQMPKNIRYVVLRHATTESPDEEESSPKSPLQDPHYRPQLRRNTPTHGDHVSPSVTHSPPDGSTLPSTLRVQSPPLDIPERATPQRKQPPQSFLTGGRPEWRSTVEVTDSALYSRSLPGCNEPCRIVVESPVEATDYGGGGRGSDSRRNSSSSAGEAPGSRRGSVSLRDQGSCPGNIPSFLWSLGSTTSFVSPGVEDQFWVPENILQKKRANSMVSPAMLSTSTSEFGESGRRLCSSLDYSSSDRLRTLGSSPSPSTSPWSDGQLTVVTQKIRRASMHSALDHTKIDASMYERPPPLSNQKPFGIVQEENLGSIHFRLTYDPDRSVVVVVLYQAVDLVPREGTTSKQLDVYARMHLLPDGGPQLTSQIHCRSLSPKFDEDFTFEVPRKDLYKKSLEIMMMVEMEGMRSPNEEEHCAGHLLLPLDQVDLSEPVYLWKGLSHYEKKTESAVAVDSPGELLLSLSYLPSAERLTVNITKARNLTHIEIPAKPVTNPYVRVTLFLGMRKLKRKKTTTKRSGQNPEWNEALVFNLAKDLFEMVQTEVAVFSENLLGTDEPVGKVTFGSNASGVEQFHWMSAQCGRSSPSTWFKMTPMEP